MKRNITFEPDAFYHIYNRGVNREKIFFNEENNLFFTRNIERYLTPVLDIIAYCLMPTHYHLLVCVRDIADQGYCQTTKAIQRFSISYTKAINKRYDRVGPLFQGPYQVKLINGIDHSRRIIPYIHENPVHAGFVNNPIDWKFSSARIYERIGDRGFLQPLTVS